MYIIRVFYETGDSFGSEDTEVVLDYGWQDLGVATENINRIESHYRMYQEYHREYHGAYSEMRRKYGNEHWFVDRPEYDATDSMKTFYSCHSVKLIMDDGKEFVYSCPWCGYFEHLFGADVEEKSLPSFRRN